MKFLRTYWIDSQARTSKQVFVFGSNMAGIHGAGAALTALQFWGAKPGAGIGHHGDSYAIPTKLNPREGLSLEDVDLYVHAFLIYAECRPDLIFLVTEVGCGLAGRRPEDIAPMFRNGLSNVLLPRKWKTILQT